MQLPESAGLQEAKAMAASAPTPVIEPERPRGRSRPRRTAAVAVAAGSRAITTAPWLAGTVVSAKEVSSGKADDDAGGHHREPRPLRAAGKPLPGECKGERGQDAGHDRAAGTDEQRREPRDGDLGERNREGEGRDSEESPPQSGGRPGQYHWANQHSSATIVSHEQR